MYSVIINFITVTIGTAKNIPNIPKYAPTKLTENITSIGLICKDVPIIFGFMIFASICCNIITTIATHIACDIPPVIAVISMAIATAIIAPKNGIKLNIPIMNANSTPYFTFIISIAIEINIQTTTESIICPDKNLKNTSFVLFKYFPKLL